MELLVYSRGQLYDYTEQGCASAVWTDVSPGGSGSMDFSVPYKQGDTIPGRYSPVLISHEVLGPLWGGRIEEWSIADWAGCDGTLVFKCLGYAVNMTDRVIQESTVYGPRPLGSTVKALTPEEAVSDAMRICGNIDIGGVSSGGLIGEETSDYMGSTPQRVVEDMAALTAYLTTPFDYHVRPTTTPGKSVFVWAPRDYGAYYEAKISDGITISITNDASDIFNEAIVGIRQDQTIVFPDDSENIRYDQIPIIRDRWVGLNGLNGNKGQARRLAQGIIQKMRDQRTGWDYVIKIPQKSKISRVGGDYIEKAGVISGKTIRIPDLDPGAFGPEHSLPTDHYITSMRYVAKDDSLELTCGETRMASAVASIRSVQDTKSTLTEAIVGIRPGYSKDLKDMRLFGPTDIVINEAPSGSETYSPLVHAIPAIENRTKQLRPETLPPLPPPLSYQIGNCTDLGIKGRMVIPPLRLMKWFMVASIPVTMSVKVTLRSTGAQVGPIYSLAAQAERVEIPFAVPIDLAKPWDMLIFEVTAGSAAEWCIIGFWTERYFPEFTGKPTASAPSVSTLP